MLQKLRELIGPVPKSEHGFIRRMRIHQGWWRAFVLGEKAGRYPNRPEQTICNTILNGDKSNNNFLTKTIAKVVHETLADRNESDFGIIQEDRLFNNLLGGQSLCFNFFSELKEDKALAVQVLNNLGFRISEVKDILFEYAPPEHYTNDNSAYDVAIEVYREKQKGLIGLECKYTDNFSQTEYDKSIYRSIFKSSNIFKESYETYKSSTYNQLFRNQLIAEASLRDKKYDFVITGLFCPDDDKAIETGRKFQSMLQGKEKVFRIITYQDFIEAIQKSDISWEKRKLSMMLWARYCATELSQVVFDSY